MNDLFGIHKGRSVGETPTNSDADLQNNQGPLQRQKRA